MELIIATPEDPPCHRELYDPVPLVPSKPLARAVLKERCVRTREGRLQIRMVLQPQAVSAPTTITPSLPFYTFKKLCYHEPRKRVSIVLAIPTIPLDTPSPCLVSCGAPVVIKIMPHPTDITTSADDPLREIAALQLLNHHHHHHPNIINIIDVFQDDQRVFIVLPYIPGGDLFVRLRSEMEGNSSRQGGGVSEARAAKYLRQVAQG